MQRSALLVLLLAFFALGAGKEPTPPTRPAEWAATKIPPNAKDLLPVLDSLLAEMWPELEDRAVIAAQIEQETCVDSIPVERQKKCWSPKAELKTEREYGFGLGGITILYDEAGQERSNGFEDVKKLDAILADWQWEDRFDGKMQLRAVIALNRKLWRRLSFEVADDREKTAFLLAAYNGGLGALLKDRALCEKTLGCEAKRWFGHVEKNSEKPKTPAPGYTKSFFEMNRDYVTQILDVRKSKYESAFATAEPKQP